MSEKNLPLKLVLSRKNDVQNNIAKGGGPKFFCEVTPQMQKELTDQLRSVGEYYQNVFKETSTVPLVAKIVMIDEAIAKSNKPNRFCKNIPIIGTDNLNEIYVKVTKEGLEKTIKEIETLPAKNFEANMTAIKEILPITPSEKIVTEIDTSITKVVKVKTFNFQDDLSNLQASDYFEEKIKNHHLEFKFKNYTKNLNNS